MLIKPSRQAPAQPWRPRSMEGAALYRMWRMCAWTFNHTLRRRPYKTVWAIVALGLAGSHAWPLFAVAIGAPLVVIGLYRHGPRLGVMDRWAVTRSWMDAASARGDEQARAASLSSMRQLFEANAPAVLPSNQLDELPQPIDYGWHRHGWYVVLSLPLGMTPADVQARSEQLAHAMGVQRCEVESPAPRQCKLMFYTSDPFADSGPASGVPQLAPFQLGVYEDGSPLIWRPDLAPHLAVVGKTGAGKSSVLLTLLLSLPQGWEVAICDFGRVEFGRFPVAGKVIAVACSLEEIEALWADQEVELHRRLALMQEADVNNIDKLPQPLSHRVILLDEAMVLLSAADDSRALRPLVDKLKSHMSAIALIGRKAGLHAVIGLQQPEAILFGSSGKRSAYSPIAMRYLDSSGISMICGSADEDIASMFDGQPGHGVVIGVDGSDKARRFKAEYVADEKEARRIICGL